MSVQSARACRIATAALISIPINATGSACRWRGSRRGFEEPDIARLRFMATKAREILAASGADDIYESYSAWDWWGASHVFGTCQMGADPGSSVVDAAGRSHRWRNLWITDASVFPSSGGGEAPSLTIEALALCTTTKIGIGD
jgi:choline dehydrogenase-like flavoprotein